MSLDNLTWLWNTFKIFPRYAPHQQIALVAFVLLAIYVGYLLTVGRPPLVVYSLVVSPSFDVGARDPRKIARGEHVELGLDIENDSDVEIQNIEGQFWTNSKHMVQASLAPATVFTPPDPQANGQALYYNFSIPLLHKHSVKFLARWIMTVPDIPADRIPIGCNVVSSQTDWQGGGWFFVRDGNGVKMIDWPR